MKFLWFNVETKKELRAKITELNNQIETQKNHILEILTDNDELEDALENMYAAFPFTLGQIVYDIQLRGDDGKFTKRNASKEHSLINEVTVDTKNYFSLVSRYHNNDVFFEMEEAEEYLESICVK